MGDEPPKPPDTEQVIQIKRKILDAFSVFDREGRNACDVREVCSWNALNITSLQSVSHIITHHHVYA